MQTVSFKQKFQEGGPTVGTRAFLPDPAIAEAIGQASDFDYVEFLAEYNAFSLHDFDNFCRAAELYGLGSMVKLDYEQSRYLAHRAIGSGFGGVLFADMRSAEDVRQAVRSARPDTPEHGGTYGAAARRGARPDYGGSAQYVASIADTVVGIMIEKREAFEDLDGLLSVPGIDFVQWGPTDFRMSSGYGTTEVAQTRNLLFDACERHGVPARVELGSPEELSEYAERGIRHFSLGMDLEMLVSEWRRLGSAARHLLDEVAVRREGANRG